MHHNNILLTKINELPWEEVVLNIKHERCVLVLGPHAILNKEGKSITSVINDYLIEVLDINEERDFLMSISCGPFHELMTRLFKHKKRASFLDHINTLIRDFDLHDVYTECLIKIPLQLVIYTAPDNILENAFNAHGIGINAQKYPFKDVHGAFDEGFPMLYYLMGKNYRDTSSVLKHEDLFDYILSVVGEKPAIPITIQNTLKRADRLIMLGFNYENWHLNVLFRLFELHKRNFEGQRSFARPIVLPSPQTMYFFRTNFHIDFIAVSDDIKDPNMSLDIIEFIKALFAKCQEADIPLRSVQKVEHHNPAVFDKMRKAVNASVDEGKKVEAFDIALAYFESRDQELAARIRIMRGEFRENTLRLAASGEGEGKLRALLFDLLKIVQKNAVAV